jgi:hypothetical protein
VGSIKVGQYERTSDGHRFYIARLRPKESPRKAVNKRRRRSTNDTKNPIQTMELTASRPFGTQGRRFKFCHSGGGILSCHVAIGQLMPDNYLKLISISSATIDVFQTMRANMANAPSPSFHLLLITAILSTIYALPAPK